MVAPLHTLLQYMCAYVTVGGVNKRHTHEEETGYRKEFGGTWGGTEGIGECFDGHTCMMYRSKYTQTDTNLYTDTLSHMLTGSELLQLQSEISRLDDPLSPSQV